MTTKTVQGDSDDDGESPKSKRKTFTGKKPRGGDAGEADVDEDEEEDQEGGKGVRLPKIYVGTRTHKQISQMVRELKSTGYKPKISILGSREHYCIHPTVSRSSSKNEDCKELLEESACQFFNNVPTLKSSRELRPGPQLEVWDIEDLVQLGRKRRGCPYFTAKSLAQNAEIIFCPYNYLIDPQIRKSMEISLEGDILILDEAHNIEESAREAGSFDVTEDQLIDVENQLQKMMNLNFLVEEHNSLLFLVQQLQDWMLNTSAKVFREELEKRFKAWTGRETKEMFESLGVSNETFKDFQAKLNKIIEATNNDEKPPPSKIPTPVLDTLNRLLMILGFLFRPDKDYANDYRMVLIQATRNDSGFGKKSWFNKLSFWCMNPRVIFEATSASAKCIVLTSGTLSPMDTFASELGVAFPLRLEAMHVIPPTSVWVGGLSTGPDGGTLLGTHKNMETLLFQDRVGNSVVDVVQAVPFGVLCFFSSYRNLERMTERWKVTGVWNSILQSKAIVVEPRSSDKDGFEAVMKKYYSAIQTAAKEHRGKKTGAIFFAVCRGKVSEGLDFTDDNARAVITVSIPYANAKDEQIELKKTYNDQNASSLKLLTGSSWYEIQAYRALNQALGRCIRHKNDWGAIILLDSRFSNDRTVKSLSKWVRNRFHNFSNYREAMSSLTDFINDKMKNHVATPQKPKGASNGSSSSFDPFVAQPGSLYPPETLKFASPPPTLPGKVTPKAAKPAPPVDSRQPLIFDPTRPSLMLSKSPPKVAPKGPVVITNPSEMRPIVLDLGESEEPVQPEVVPAPQPQKRGSLFPNGLFGGGKKRSFQETTSVPASLEPSFPPRSYPKLDDTRSPAPTTALAPSAAIKPAFSPSITLVSQEESVGISGNFPQKLTFCCLACGSNLFVWSLGSSQTPSLGASGWVESLPLEVVRTSFGCTLKELCRSSAAEGAESNSLRGESFASNFQQFMHQGDSQSGILDVSLFVFREIDSLLASSTLVSKTPTSSLNNATWSEGDSACFRLFFCSSCSSTAHPLAIQLLSVRPTNLQLSPYLDSLWVLPEMVSILEAPSPQDLTALETSIMTPAEPLIERNGVKDDDDDFHEFEELMAWADEEDAAQEKVPQKAPEM